MTAASWTSPSGGKRLTIAGYSVAGSAAQCAGDDGHASGGLDQAGDRLADGDRQPADRARAGAACLADPRGQRQPAGHRLASAP